MTGSRVQALALPPPCRSIARARRRACSRYASSNRGPGSRRAHHACAGDDGGHGPTRHEELGGPDLDGVDDGHGADGRPGTNGRFEGNRWSRAHPRAACRRRGRGRRPPGAARLLLAPVPSDIDWATDVTAMTRRPRAFAPRAISTPAVPRGRSPRTPSSRRGHRT